MDHRNPGEAFTATEGRFGGVRDNSAHFCMYFPPQILIPPRFRARIWGPMTKVSLRKFSSKCRVFFKNTSLDRTSFINS